MPDETANGAYDDPDCDVDGNVEGGEKMPETPEVVACTAICGPRGITFAGKRHHNCLAQIKAAGFGGLWRIESTQGFMTTHGRFVGREEARKIQDAAGIQSADPGGYRGSELLFSEDLY